MARQYILDRSWAGRAFLAPPSSLSDSVNNRRRYYTSSSRKFTDTTLGGNFAMNPLPQFTENCDFKHKSIYSKSKGVGRWWSEVLEDNSQLIHIRPGVPMFNTMANYFGNFYNVHAGSVARSGRAPSIWFEVGRVAGVIGTLPLQPFILGGSMTKFFAGMPRSKYYYHKPTSYPYWYAMANMVNGIFVNLGLSPHYVTEDQKRFFDPAGTPNKVDIDSMRRIFPDLVMAEGGIDVFRMMTKPQRLASQYRAMLDDVLDGITGDPNRRAEEFSRILLQGVDDGIKGMDDPGASLSDLEKAYLAFSGEYNSGTDPTSSDEVKQDDEGWWARWWEQARDEARMGAEFVTFRVNNTGSQSDSFSNQSTEPSIATELNAMSSKAAMSRFNLMDGNFGGPIGTVIQAAKDVATGVLLAAQVEGFIAVAGNAFADIQKVYQSSSADLNRTSFTMPLRAWSHDDWVRLQNLFIPLSAIACLGLPRATGRASYTGPFMLEVFNQGRTMIREGMIESMTFERGVGDVGFAKGGKVLNIDVTVTIVDFSNVLSVPINPGFSSIQGAFNLLEDAFRGTDRSWSITDALSKSTYGEDNKYTDWLSTIASVPLEVQINMTRRWQLNMARQRAEFGQWKSPARVASGMMNTMPGELFKAISMPTDRG